MNAVPSPPISVAIVEDDKRFRNHLVALVDGTPGFRCSAACSNAEVAVVEIPDVRPDLILVDLLLPREGGLELIPRLRERLPEAGIVVLTSSGDDLHLFRALQFGAVSYLAKAETSPAELIENLRQTRSGGSPMSPSIAVE